MTEAPPTVRITDLVVDRGDVRVLPGMSLRLDHGGIVGLLGPSGCGKSTLMRSIVGVQIVTGGTVEVLGEPAGSASLRHRVGYMTQAPSVYGDLTVDENLRFFAAMLGIRDGRIDAVIEQVDLSSFRSRTVNTLSGGQRNRVSLAVALLGEPDLLVLDEPTVGLDPLLRESLWATFRELADAGVTLLVSSHVMEEASRCDRLLLMYEGEIVADDTVAGIRERGGSHDLDACFLTIIRAAKAKTGVGA